MGWLKLKLVGRRRAQANKASIEIEQQMGLELDWLVTFVAMVIRMGRKWSYILGHQRMGRRFVDR